MQNCQVVSIDHCLLGKIQAVVRVGNVTHRGEDHFLLEDGACGGALRYRLPCWPCQLADQGTIAVCLLIVVLMIGVCCPLFVEVDYGKSVGVFRLVELDSKIGLLEEWPPEEGSMFRTPPCLT